MEAATVDALAIAARVGVTAAASATARRAKTAAPAWATPPSAPSATRSTTPRPSCASWPRRPGEALTQLLGAWQQRQPDQVPSAQELGRAVSASVRSAWTQAVGSGAGDTGKAGEALLRLEMAAEVPTPADQLAARRALQLQLLTRRNDPAPPKPGCRTPPPCWPARTTKRRPGGCKRAQGAAAQGLKPPAAGVRRHEKTRTATRSCGFFYVVPGAGIEPARCCHRQILRLSPETSMRLAENARKGLLSLVFRGVSPVELTPRPERLRQTFRGRGSRGLRGFWIPN
jgi:hypothetical protein